MTAPLYREYIRDVLALADPFGVTEKAMQDGVDSLVPGPIDVSMFRDAVEWNLSKDYIRARDNEDTDQKEWKLTAKGEAKQQG